MSATKLDETFEGWRTAYAGNQTKQQDEQIGIRPIQLSAAGRGIAGAFPRDVPVYGDTEDRI